MTGNIFQRMPKSRQLSYCCFVNNIRYLILILLIACLSILFANIILYSVAVIYDDYQVTQLWKQIHSTQLTSTKKRRFLQNVADENNLDSSNRRRHLAEILETANFNFNETNQSYGTNNVTFAARNLFSDTILNEERTTTIGSNLMDPSILRKHKNSEELIYKNGLPFDKDRESLKWDGNPKDGSGKARQQVEIEGIAHRTVEKKMQHFLVWTAPGIGMFCGSFFTSWFLRSFGGRRFFAVMMILSAIATVLLAMTPQIKYGRYLTVCMRFIQGFAFSSVFPMIGLVTANWGTLKHQFLFLICCTCFIQLAPLISWPVSSFIFARDYRIPFFIHATVTCLLALIWLVFFREKPQYHFSVNGLELNKIVAGKIKAEHNRILAENPCRLLIMSFPVWAIWIAACGYFVVVSVAVQFLPLYCLLIVRETRTDSGILAAVPFLFMFIMMQFHGLWYRLAKFFTERISILAFNTISFIICSLIFIFLAIFPPGGTFHHSNVDEWRVMFLILAAFLLICAAVFGIFGSASPEEWSKDSWDPSAARPMITFDQIDYHADECGILEMRILG
ncbi:transporter, major facilitator family protein [Onchocerca flexuosa]|uniref:Transporter, major facilitator family protein n=1 Tax=Onchocerca flexuosa TaxID=387005 RepID=A0A238C3K5_9BILA|nr:transporter, major facilitator family protein [Onchocerca flexuosa]